MNNNKQTAVEWLITELNPELNYIPITQWDRIRDLVQRAKEMEKQQDKFTNAPIHDKKEIIEMMNNLHPKEMAEVVEFIKIKIETYGTNRNNTAVS